MLETSLRLRAAATVLARLRVERHLDPEEKLGTKRDLVRSRRAAWAVSDLLYAAVKASDLLAATIEDGDLDRLALITA